MPTVIDSLIVTLGLDPKNFEDNQKKVAESWLKTIFEMEKRAKRAEKATDKVADAVNRVSRRILELWATITGSRALADFIDKLDVADASLGRFASALGQSPQRVAAWENASERFGGSASATAATLEKVNKQLFDLNRNGQMLPREFSQLQAWTGMHIDPNHGINKYLHDTSAALQRLHNIDPSAAHNVAMALGIDPGTEQLMYKMGAGIDAYLQKLEKSLSPSDKAIKAAQELQERWRALQQQIIALANQLMEKLGPALVNIIDKMQQWIDKNGDWLKSKIVDAVQKFASYIQSIDWNAVGQGLKDFGTDARAVVDAIGGIKTATEVLFGLWLGSKFLAVLANVRAMAGAEAAAAGGGLLGKLLTGLGVSAAVGIVDPKDKAGSWIDKHIPGASAIDNFFSKFGFGRSYKEQGLTVDGRPISQSNPMPVKPSDQQSSSGGGFWSSIGNAISSIFGGGSGSGGASSVTPSKGVGKWWTPERQEHAYERLRKEAHLSDAGARALVSRWSTIEARGGPTSANNIGGGHYGIGQWGKSRNGIWGDPNFDHQLSFAIRELNTTEKVAGDALRRAKSDAEGAVGASMYERAEGYNRWTGMDNFTRATLSGMKGVVTGAHAAALSNIGATHTATTSNTANNIHIGKVDVHTQATDANGIAADISESLRRKLMTNQANFGLA